MDRMKILCVDDEPNVLEGLALHLRRAYDVAVAQSGPAGLEQIAQRGPFAVVLSDMRMPGMDGAAFLGRVRETSPDTTRMLLTGQCDLTAAIAAVNEGQIFRFLTKPCPPDQLRAAVDAAAEQYRLVVSERVLLEQTLQGSIRTLIDVLSITSPRAFGRAARIKKYVSALAEALGVRNRWQVELAAMLSQLGAISLPEKTAEKFYEGRDLSDEEKRMVSRVPEVTEKLLANIPRLEPVREILAKQTSTDADVPLGAKILKVVLEFDELESGGAPARQALDTMLDREGRYDPRILQTFARIRIASEAQWAVVEVPLREIKVGMVFARDVWMKSGVLLVARGYEVTQGFLEKVHNFKKGTVEEPLYVIVRKDKEETRETGGAA